jgi:hypothetical protein
MRSVESAKGPGAVEHLILLSAARRRESLERMFRGAGEVGRFVCLVCDWEERRGGKSVC